MIPEAQHLESLFVQPERPFFIPLLLQCMLCAIGFNNQSFFVAGKINYKPADLLLAAEFEPPPSASL